MVGYAYRNAAGASGSWASVPAASAGTTRTAAASHAAYAARRSGAARLACAAPAAITGGELTLLKLDSGGQ